MDGWMDGCTARWVGKFAFQQSAPGRKETCSLQAKVKSYPPGLHGVLQQPRCPLGCPRPPLGIYGCCHHTLAGLFPPVHPLRPRENSDPSMKNNGLFAKEVLCTSTQSSAQVSFPLPTLPFPGNTMRCLLSANCELNPRGCDGPSA